MAFNKPSFKSESEPRTCALPNCYEPGEYRAPKGKDKPGEYQYLCLEHVRAFNKAWNYFDGMSQAQIEMFQRDASFGHRPTWRPDRTGYYDTTTLEAALNHFIGEAAATKKHSPPISARSREYLAVLNLEHPTDRTNIRKQYKLLVKKHHPDVNRGNKNSEEAFKRVTEAYNYLIEHYELIGET